MADLALIRELEERLVNVWPAVTTLMMEGWVVRFANGYSGRANSASALVPGATADEKLCATIEALYRSKGLKPTFRLSPLATASMESKLGARGYVLKDEACTMMRTLVDFHDKTADPRIVITRTPSRAWAEGLSARQEPSKRSPEHLLAIVSRLKVPAGFATLYLDGKESGFAFSAIDRGWAELGLIMIDESFRTRGFGRQLVTSLMAWAAVQGAKHAFLQVDIRNTPAIQLYKGLGFAPVYTYRTFYLPAQT